MLFELDRKAPLLLSFSVYNIFTICTEVYLHVNGMPEFLLSVSAFEERLSERSKHGKKEIAVVPWLGTGTAFSSNLICATCLSLSAEYLSDELHLVTEKLLQIGTY
jgi:hypothetical protein